MADKPNGYASLLALIAIVFVIGKCVGGDPPADPVSAPSVVQEASAAFVTPDAAVTEDATATAQGGDDGSVKANTGTTETTSSGDDDSTEPTTSPALSGSGSYIDSDGHEVSSPVYAPQAPEGASAQCRDGTYSFSHHRRGACSHHGGVAEWL